MKTRFLTVLTVILLFSSMGLAQTPEGPLQEFNFTTSGPTGNFTGGEHFVLNASFDNVADRELPVVVNLTVNSSEVEVVGGEISSLNGSIYSENSETSLSTGLKCKSYTGDKYSSYYICRNKTQDGILPQSENNLTVKGQIAINIVPGEYNFEMDVRSLVGLPSDSKQENITGNGTVSVGNANVSIKTSNNSNVTVSAKTYDDLAVDKPNNTDTVGAVDIEVKDSGSGKKAKASGTVRINYKQSTVDARNIDESSLDIHFYNKTSEEWEIVGGNVNVTENFVEANVSHFSLYAAFGEVEPPEETFNVELPDFNLPDYSDRIDVSEPPQSDTTQQNQTSQDNETQVNQTETGEDTGQQQDEPTDVDNPGQQGGLLTGRFAGGTSSIVVVAVFIVLVAGYLIYSERNFIEYLRT